MNTETIRRRSNGTVDIDFYRASALSERAVVMTSFMRKASRVWRPAVALSIVLATLWAMPPRQPSSPSMTAMASNVASQAQ